MNYKFFSIYKKISQNSDSESESKNVRGSSNENDLQDNKKFSFKDIFSMDAMRLHDLIF